VLREQRLALRPAVRLVVSSPVVSAAWVPLRAEWPMGRAELRRRAEACGPEAMLAPHSEQAELRSAIPAAASRVAFQVAFAARLPLAEGEVPAVLFVPDASRDESPGVSLGESEVHPPRVESAAEEPASDGSGALLRGAAVAAQAEWDVQAQPEAPGAAEVQQLAEAAA
jgi:hypothetical protein